MITLADVEAAQERIGDIARRTPLTHSPMFSTLTGAEIHLKLEMFQRTGAFKIRGAANRIKTLSPSERSAGVVTASAGNHAQGVALAASRNDVASTIVMPEYAPVSKVAATEYYGGEVVLHGVDYDEAAARAHEIEHETGRTYLPAFDDSAVMAGQGTIGLEILDEYPAPDAVLVPIGGGGLISGIATAIKGRHPKTRVIGVEAEGAAKAAESLANGVVTQLDEVDTIADGIATRQVGELPFEVIKERVDEIVTVSDSDIAVALVYALERAKILVEGAGAVPLAAVLADVVEYEDGEVLVPVLSGGNIDMNMLTTVILRGLVETGRYLKIRTVLPDRPGALRELTALLAAERANIYAIQHDRTSRDIALNDAEVEIDLETRGHDHGEALLETLAAEGYDVDVLM